MKINLEDGKVINLTIRKNEKGVYEYYYGNFLLGVYAPNVMKGNQFLEVDLEKLNTLDNELSAESKDEIKQVICKVKEQIEELDLETIEQEAKETAVLDEYMQEVGINREKVKSVTTVELNRKKQKEEKPEEQVELEKSPKVATTKDVNIRQTIDINEKVNDVQDIKAWLGEKLPAEVQKIAVIDADDGSELTDENGDIMDVSPSTRFILVTIDKNNKVEPLRKYIPQLEQTYASGTNETYQISTEGSVEKDSALSEYRIGRKIIQLDKDVGKHFEFNIGQASPYQKGLVTNEVRGQYTTFRPDKSALEANGYYKGIDHPRKIYEEAQRQEEQGYQPEEFTRRRYRW